MITLLKTFVLQMSKVGCREGTEETEHSAYTEGESPESDICPAVFGKTKRTY